MRDGLWIQIPDALVDAIVERILSRGRELIPPAIEAADTPYMNVEQAAAFLCCKSQRIRDLISAGRLSRCKDAGRTLVLRREVEALVKVEERAR